MRLKPCLGCGELSPVSRCRLCRRASPYQRSGWRKLAREVVEDHDGRCIRCGSTYYVSAHHVIPRIEGGPDHPSNLEPLCASCHAKETHHDR
jgi:5-methylcytosine-specific restriction endonuclease McrA